jgi:type III pantothenate kinase
MPAAEDNAVEDSMDINLLTLNIGNSRLAIGVFAAGELQSVLRLPHAERAAWPEAISAAWKTISSGARPAIAAASVSPKLLGPMDELVIAQTGQKPQWIGREVELPIEVRTENPAETGVDRVLNIAAAFEQLGAACVVVDAGTAVTVDFCNDNGDFLGGAISPGASVMLQAMNEKTAALPKVALAAPHGAIGTSTAEAMRQGVYHGIRGLVRETVENYATELGRWPDVIATGGDAELLFGGWELIHAVAPDLTLYGIALAFTEHHIRHDT